MCWGLGGERDVLLELSGLAGKADESQANPIQRDAPRGGGAGEDLGGTCQVHVTGSRGAGETAVGESDLLSLSLNFLSYECENICKNDFHTTVR